MAQHLLLSSASKTLSLGRVFRMNDVEAETTFRGLRWPETNGAPVCPHCGGVDAYDCRRPSGAPRFRCRAGEKDLSITSGTLFASHKLALRVYLAAMALQIAKEQLSRAVEGQAHVFPSTFAERGPIARHSMSQGLGRVIDSLPPGDDGGDDDKNAIASLRANPPTPHDFRRSVATGLAALGALREDRLVVLAHAQSDVRGQHYDKFERSKQKRAALVLWENYLAKIIAPAPAAENVVKIGGQRSAR